VEVVFYSFLSELLSGKPVPFPTLPIIVIGPSVALIEMIVRNLLLMDYL